MPQPELEPPRAPSWIDEPPSDVLLAAGLLRLLAEMVLGRTETAPKPQKRPNP